MSASTSNGGKRALRLELDAEDVSQGLGRLVVGLLDLVRQLLERQALRRVDADALTVEQTERLGRALLALEGGIEDLRDAFGVMERDVALPVQIVDLDGTEQTGGYSK